MSNCFIRARFFVKATGDVCCLVRDGAGELHTWVYADGRTSCDCGESACYHVRLIWAKEAFRVAARILAFPVPAVRSTARQDALSSCSTSCKVGRVTIPPVNPPETLSERMERAPLNGNRAFSLLK